MKIGICGLGFVGEALRKSLMMKGVETIAYDKYKRVETGGHLSEIKIEALLDSEIIFLCLPSLFIEGYGYDLTAIQETCRILSKLKYKGLVVLKSTVEPGTTKNLKETFKLNMAYNPEFLTARTAFDDLHNQKHIVIGFDNEEPQKLIELFSKYYPDAIISKGLTAEAESMKLFCNCFYAMKVQIFTEYFLMCQKLGLDFETIKEMMFKNGWVGETHTNIPGPDTKLSYGGACVPGYYSVRTINGNLIKLNDLYNLNDKPEILSVNFNCEIKENKQIKNITKRKYSGKMVKITLESGEFFLATPEHLMPIEIDKKVKIKKINDLKLGDNIYLCTKDI